MAHKKAGGSTRNGRDSAGRRLGVKKFGGEKVFLVILFLDKGELSFTQEKMFQLVRIIQSLLSLKALLHLKKIFWKIIR